MVIRRGLARRLSKERHLLLRLTTQVRSQGSTEWRRELTPVGCLLISICVPWHLPPPHIHPRHTHMYICTHMCTQLHRHEHRYIRMHVKKM